MEKRVVITGGSSGIGAAAARDLRGRGYAVTIVGRSVETDRLAKEIGADAIRADFAQLSEVKRLADELLKRYPRIDVLVNNAGGVFEHRRVTADGHEMTFQVNHLAGFYLTELLRERLEASNAKVINTASAAHLIGKLDLNDLESERNYGSLRVYGTSKLMNVLHAQEIARRFKGVRAASYHPGGVATGISRDASRFMKFLYETPLKNLFMISPLKGAETLLWLIDSDEWPSGGYFSKKHLSRLNTQAKDEALARGLWEKSASLVGVRA